MDTSIEHEYSADKKRIHTTIKTYDMLNLFDIFIKKGKNIKDVIRYLNSLNIPSSLTHIVALLDAYDRSQGIQTRDFDKTVRNFTVYTDALRHILEVMYNKVLPTLNSDLAVYTFKKYKKQYIDYAHMLSILCEVENALKRHYVDGMLSRKELKDKLLLFYRSIYGLKEMTENMLIFFLKFKLPKTNTKLKNISLTMIDDYPLYGENLLFGRYATNVRNRHFHEEFEAAIRNYKTAIAGVIPRMNHNSKLLNGTAEKYFKKNFRTPINDAFAIMILWCIEAVHISESMGMTLKTLGDPEALQEEPEGEQQERGYAAVEAYDGTLVCEVSVKGNKIISLRYYDGSQQNAKIVNKTIKTYLSQNKDATELQRNIELLHCCLMPNAVMSVKQTIIEEKEPPPKEKAKQTKERV
jgi:hypothetical protein